MTVMYNADLGIAVAKLGLPVIRATSILPQTTTTTIFTVAGGLVLVNQIIGTVTTVIETQANATNIISTPTTGSAADICDTLDITADEAGTLYGVTGLGSDAMLGVNAGTVPGQVRGFYVPIGNIQVVCAASNTGAIQWTIWYMPVEAGASLVAA